MAGHLSAASPLLQGKEERLPPRWIGGISVCHRSQPLLLTARDASHTSLPRLSCFPRKDSSGERVALLIAPGWQLESRRREEGGRVMEGGRKGMARGAFDLDFPLLTITHILSFANATPSPEEQAACLQSQPLPSMAHRGSLTGKPVRVKGKSRRCEWETASREREGEARTVVRRRRAVCLSLSLTSRSCDRVSQRGAASLLLSAAGVKARVQEE